MSSQLEDSLSAIALALAFAIEPRSTRIKVNAKHPGFTSSDLNDLEGIQTVEQAAREPAHLALLDANSPLPQ